jgi:VanZ family protein
MHFILKKFIPAILYLILVTVLLCLPGKAFSSVSADWMEQYHIDKVIHVGIFALLVFLFCNPIQAKGFFNNLIVKVYFIIMIVAIIYGLIMEFVQGSFVANRSFDWLDVVADIVGAYIGYSFVKNKIKKQKPPTKEEMQEELKSYAKKVMGDKAAILDKFK